MDTPATAETGIDADAYGAISQPLTNASSTGMHPIQPCPPAAGLSRRRVFGLAVKAGVALAALTGGWVKFTPTAYANACDVLIAYISPGTCWYACFGSCSTLRSWCNYNPTPYYCLIDCGGFCSPARAVAICYLPDESGICCAQYC